MQAGRGASTAKIWLVRTLVLCAMLFAAMAKAAWPPPQPSQAVLRVVNTTNVARTDELIRGGVPLARTLNVTSTAGIAVVDENGTAVPASLRILARWNAGPANTAAPAQWLLVQFRASLAAGATRQFRLRLDGSVANPAPAVALQLTQAGGQVDVNTGTARFVLSGTAPRAFERIERSGGVALATGGRVAATVDSALLDGFISVRRVLVEHSDALVASVIVDGVYANGPDGPISGGRRFEFLAGSPAVTVREWLDWEGQRCGVEALTCDGTPHGRAVQRWRLSLAPSLTGTRTVSLQANATAAPSSTTAAAGSTASLRQLRRSERHVAQRYDLLLPGQALATGARAENGVILLAGNEGTLAVAMKDMADYEPQALRLLADGTLAVDMADDGAWLAAHQGMFAEYRIGAYAPGVSAADAASRLWPALAAPLLALPAPAWVGASGATDEFPVGTLAPALSSYDTWLADLMQRTVTLRRDRGLEGLMTFGLFPRNWGNPVLSDEIDCGDNDPTPADDWDDPFWCAFWTDYHNASASAYVAAWRYGDPRPLYQLAMPAALRHLHTQLFRCAPDDPYTYCGMTPAGYGGYRLDFNTSHGYTESVVMQYWMTGDRTIVERLRQGAEAIRAYLCPARGNTPPGPVCGPTDPIVDTFAGVNDRAATQGYQLFRFVGLTDDAAFLDDWRSNTARFLTQNFALVNTPNGEVGITEPSGAGDLGYITGPGTYYSTQLWMASLYDFNQLYRLERDTLDAPLGQPAFAPSRARHGWARLLHQAPGIPPGDGTAAGVWPNEVRYTFTGARVGGTLTALEPGWLPAPQPDPCLDRCLYDAGKATLVAALARSADDLGNAGLRARALEISQRVLGVIATSPVPMGKASGEFFSRLHVAVARLSLAGVNPDVLFADGYED